MGSRGEQLSRFAISWFHTQVGKIEEMSCL